MPDSREASTSLQCDDALCSDIERDRDAYYEALKIIRAYHEPIKASNHIDGHYDHLECMVCRGHSDYPCQTVAYIDKVMGANLK